MSDIADWLESMSEKAPAAALAAKMIRAQDPEANIQELFGQAQQMVEDFGPDPAYPDRPDHEDFRSLARIIWHMDAVAETEGAHVVWQNPEMVDITSMLYMAKQRVARGLELLDDGKNTKSTKRDMMTIMWLDAFTLGMRFAAEKAPTVEQLLDQSIDGSRRVGRTNG